MKAVICTRYGPPEVLHLREVPKPHPKPNQLLVKIMATAVNSGDVRVRKLEAKGFLKLLMRLIFGFSKPRKPILGTVFSGVVEAVGDSVSEFKIGDKVFGMTGFSFGTHAEYIAVNQHSNVLHMPKNATYEEAAAIIFGGQTAIHFLNKAKISRKVHPTLLILGATGSVGAAAIQIARHYHAHVTAVCSSNGQHLMNELGVEKCLHYDTEDFTKLTDRFDIILDAVGKYRKHQCNHLLKPNGAFVSVNAGYANETLQQLQLLKDLFEKGALKATIDRTFTLDTITEANRYVDSGRKKGNVVVQVNE